MNPATSAIEGMDTTDAPTDLWRVQLATGEVRAMSVDGLDDAFQSGLIDESTPVLPPGATLWTKLADAAGLDAPPASEPVESTVPSLAPIAVNVPDASERGRSYAPSSMTGLPETDLDALDDHAFKPKKTRVLAGLGLAVLVVSGLGFAATRVGNVAGSAQSSLSAPAQTAAAAAAAPLPAVDLNEAFPAKALTEEQKVKLAEADKAREARDAAKRRDRPSAGRTRSNTAHDSSTAHEKSAPFVNGGNKYDPLNGAL
jgi:hypothetical protein